MKTAEQLQQELNAANARTSAIRNQLNDAHDEVLTRVAEMAKPKAALEKSRTKHYGLTEEYGKSIAEAETIREELEQVTAGAGQ